MSELNLEFFEDMYMQREELLGQLDEPDLRSAERHEIHRRLNAVNEALGLETESEDALVDQWERDIAEGRVPDLEAR